MPFYFRAEIKVYSKLLIVLEGGQIGGQIQLTELQIFTQHLSTWIFAKTTKPSVINNIFSVKNSVFAFFKQILHCFY